MAVTNPKREALRLADSIGRCLTKWRREASDLRQIGEDVQAEVLDAVCSDLENEVRA